MTTNNQKPEATQILSEDEREETIRCLDQIQSKIFSIEGMHAQVPEIISICIALRSWLRASALQSHQPQANKDEVEALREVARIARSKIQILNTKIPEYEHPESVGFIDSILSTANKDGEAWESRVNRYRNERNTYRAQYITIVQEQAATQTENEYLRAANKVLVDAIKGCKKPGEDKDLDSERKLFVISMMLGNALDSANRITAGDRG